jgi:hypothetical protein
MNLNESASNFVESTLLHGSLHLVESLELSSKPHLLVFVSRYLVLPLICEDMKVALLLMLVLKFHS